MTFLSHEKYIKQKSGTDKNGRSYWAIRLHSMARVNHSEQLGVSFQTGKIRFELHI
jgi:hypothetical protein